MELKDVFWVGGIILCTPTIRTSTSICKVTKEVCGVMSELCNQYRNIHTKTNYSQTTAASSVMGTLGASTKVELETDTSSDRESTISSWM